MLLLFFFPAFFSSSFFLFFLSFSYASFHGFFPCDRLQFFFFFLVAVNRSDLPALLMARSFFFSFPFPSSFFRVRPLFLFFF